MAESVRDRIKSRCVEILKEQSEILTPHFKNLDWISDARFQDAFIDIYNEFNPRALLEPSLILDLIPEIKNEKLLQRNEEDFWEALFETGVKSEDSIECKTPNGKVKLDIESFRQELAKPGAINKYDSNYTQKESICDACYQLVNFDLLKPFSLIHRLDSPEADYLCYQNFQFTSSNSRTNFHGDPHDALICNLSTSLKFWLFLGFDWRLNPEVEKLDFEQLLSMGVRWCLILPHTTLHLPKDHAHFVITLDVGTPYFGIYTNYLSFEDAVGLLKNLKEDFEKSDPETPLHRNYIKVQTCVTQAMISNLQSK